MTRLPYMPLDWSRFFADGKVATLPIEAQGIYVLLLGRMWLNQGWLSAEDKIICKQIGVDIRSWRRTYKPLLEPLLRRDIDAYIGAIYTQKHLTEVRLSALDLVSKNKARTARATAAKSAKARKSPTVTTRKPATVTEPVTKPVTETATSSKVKVEKEEALPIKKAESFFPPKSQDLSASSGEIVASGLPPAPVASPSRKGGSLPPPSPALLRSRIVKGNGHAGSPEEPEPGRDRGDQEPLPEPPRAAPADEPAAGLFGLVEAARRRKDDDEH